MYSSVLSTESDGLLGKSLSEPSLSEVKKMTLPRLRPISSAQGRGIETERVEGPTFCTFLLSMRANSCFTVIIVHMGAYYINVVNPDIEIINICHGRRSNFASSIIERFEKATSALLAIFCHHQLNTYRSFVPYVPEG